MMDPTLLAGTPFRNRSAFEDLVGTVSFMHNALIQSTVTLTGIPPTRYALDPAAPQADLLQAIQAQHASLAESLGIAQPSDLQSFDLTDATDFASWTFLLADDLTRLRDAAGIV